MRLDLAGTRALAEALKCFEDGDADDGGEGGARDGGKTLRAAEEKKQDCGGIPDPTVAEARGSDHPDANPTRRAPAIHAAHEAMIATLDETPDVAGDGHLVPR